jgi:hypothetical protein
MGHFAPTTVHSMVRRVAIKDHHATIRCGCTLIGREGVLKGTLCSWLYTVQTPMEGGLKGPLCFWLYTDSSMMMRGVAGVPSIPLCQIISFWLLI